MNLKNQLTKQDFVYFFSIIGSFLSIIFLHSIPLLSLMEPYFNFTYSPKQFIYFFSTCILSMSFIKRCTALIKLETSKTHPIETTDAGLTLSVILIMTLIYAVDINEKFWSESRVYEIMSWFLIGRFFNLCGQFLNSLTSIKAWNIFGDAMSVFALIIAIGTTFGIDMYLFL